jgi:hypothetical protein
VFDENVFPFSEMHSNDGAHLQQETLLLPNHLLNPGDAISGLDVTDVSLDLAHLLFCRILQKIRRKMMHPRCKSQVIMGCSSNPLLARFPRSIRLHQRRLQAASDPRRIFPPNRA